MIKIYFYMQWSHSQIESVCENRYFFIWMAHPYTKNLIFACGCLYHPHSKIKILKKIKTLARCGPPPPPDPRRGWPRRHRPRLLCQVGEECSPARRWWGRPRDRRRSCSSCYRRCPLHEVAATRHRSSPPTAAG